MINSDGSNKSNHHTNWINIPDPFYRILKSGGSGSRKTNSPLNLINLHPDIDKTYYT